jgi:hypothetical protein
MLRLILTIFTMIAMAHVQLYAKTRTTCSFWESGSYTPKIGGVSYKCKSKRTCTTTETDPDGQCRKVFGCSTTHEIQYGDCTKAAAGGPGMMDDIRPEVGGVLDRGPSQPPRNPVSGATGGTLKAQ